MLPMGGDAPEIRADNLPQFKKKGGMFGGNALQGIAGMIGDYLLQRGGGSPIYAPMMLRRQQMQQEEDQYQRHRQDSVQDWITQQTWDRAHPKPVNNDTTADYDYISSKLGPEAAQQFLRVKTNPIVMTPYGPMPYSQVNPSAPQAPVGRLTPIDDGGQGLGGPGGFL